MMSGVVAALCAMYVGKCGPMCCRVLFVRRWCICLPFVFVDLYPRMGWFAFKSVIMYTGMCLRKRVKKSGIGR